MKHELLLSDELYISDSNYNERLKLKKVFLTMPEDFFSKLRHFQPQIGCLNACSICSKYASTNVSYWNEDRIRNVIAALKYSTPATELPLIVWDRKNHRNGVIFSYLDNDVGCYEYLDKFIEIAHRELGVRTRISTVGFSKYNQLLNEIHNNISINDSALAGVRLSFTPYEIGWVCNNNQYSRSEYKEDIINFLKIYKKYYEKVGSGSLYHIEFKGTFELVIHAVKGDEVYISFLEQATEYSWKRVESFVLSRNKPEKTAKIVYFGKSCGYYSIKLY